jgi:hypothetical protein
LVAGSLIVGTVARLSAQEQNAPELDELFCQAFPDDPSCLKTGGPAPPAPPQQQADHLPPHTARPAAGNAQATLPPRNHETSPACPTIDDTDRRTEAVVEALRKVQEHIAQFDKTVDALNKQASEAYINEKRWCFRGLEGRVSQLRQDLQRLENIEYNLSETQELLSCIDSRDRDISDHLKQLQSTDSLRLDQQARLAALSGEQQRIADVRSKLVDLDRELAAAIDKRTRLDEGVQFLEELCKVEAGR